MKESQGTMIVVERPRNRRHNGRLEQWAHMWCIGELQDLHKFARLIGLKRCWFQNKEALPHYDLRPAKVLVALLHGAYLGDIREGIRYWRKKRGE